MGTAYKRRSKYFSLLSYQLKPAENIFVYESRNTTTMTIVENNIEVDEAAFAGTLQQTGHYLEITIPDLQAQLKARQYEYDELKILFEKIRLQNDADMERINMLLDQLREMRQFINQYKRINK